MEDGMFEGQQILDGKPVKKYLWQRKLVVYVPDSPPVQVVEVHAFSKDHSIARLLTAFPGSIKREWEFNMELEPQHFVGRVGEVLRLDPKGVR